MKSFNTTGLCIPEKHYIVNIEHKLSQIFKMIELGEYFTINRARQYGKTTTIMQIYRELKDKYLILDISFEGLGETAFSSESNFIKNFIKLITKRLKQIGVEKKIIENWMDIDKSSIDFSILSDKITDLVDNNGKNSVLIIDEVDKSSNNQLFLNFLGLLRNKYLDREKGYDSTFKSVILAGIYENSDGSLDIKRALQKYQEYIKSVYNNFDKDFIERQERLLLLAFFKPIINGKGFYFVESHTGYEQRQDVVITYENLKYIIELKIWRGTKYYNDGIKQLINYLKLENVDNGYLVIYDKNKNKQYKDESLEIENKRVFIIWV